MPETWPLVPEKKSSVGDAAVIVRYRAHPAMMRVLVPRPGTSEFPEVAVNNFIDKHVLDKLRRLNLPPSPLAVC